MEVQPQASDLDPDFKCPKVSEGWEPGFCSGHVTAQWKSIEVSVQCSRQQLFAAPQSLQVPNKHCVPWAAWLGRRGSFRWKG